MAVSFAEAANFQAEEVDEDKHVNG